MNIFKILLCVMSFTLLSCTSQNKEKSIALNDEASKLIVVAAQKEDLEKALELLDKSISLDKNNVTALSNKVTVFVQLGRNDEAINLIETTDSLKSMPESYLFLGVLYDKKGDVDKAKFIYREVISIFDSKPDNDKYKTYNTINKYMAYTLLEGREKALELLEAKDKETLSEEDYNFTIQLINEVTIDALLTQL